MSARLLALALLLALSLVPAAEPAVSRAAAAVPDSLRDRLYVSPEVVDAFLASRGWNWRGLDRGDYRIGEEKVTLEAIQEYLVVVDPVTFAAVNLRNRPEDGGAPWQLFDFQRSSARYRGDVVHEDGAEVGKTREIVLLTLWMSTTGTGGILVGGTEDGNLDEIWDELEWQLSQNAFLRGELLDTKQKPYRKMVWRNGNRVVFRPAGHDGRAFRGVHVAQAAFNDETAKQVTPAQLHEFFRAMKAGCEARLYSVPDGNRTTRYAQICERAIPAETLPLPPPWERQRARSGAALPKKAASKVTGGRRFVRFNWPQTLKPNLCLQHGPGTAAGICPVCGDPTLWGPAREAEMIERFGGRDSSGYVRNVLGQHGDPEDSVFPWSTLGACIRYVEEYRVAKLLVDSATSTLYVQAHRLTAGYQVRGGAVMAETEDDDHGPSPLTEEWATSFPFGNIDWEGIIRRLFPPPEGRHLVGGIDVGRSAGQPTEVSVSHLAGSERRWITRLQLKAVKWDDQARILSLLDERLGRPDHGWGLDATGVGRVLEETMRGASGGHRWDGHLSGYVFNSKTDALDANGEPVIDPANGRPVKVTMKELGTQLLEKGFQRGHEHMPWDPDLIRDFTSHTARTLPSGGRQFSETNDHTIDARRVERLRLHEMEQGMGAPLAAAGVPQGAARESWDSLTGRGAGGATGTGGGNGRETFEGWV